MVPDLIGWYGRTTAIREGVKGDGGKDVSDSHERCKRDEMPDGPVDGGERRQKRARTHHLLRNLLPRGIGGETAAVLCCA